VTRHLNPAAKALPESEPTPAPARSEALVESYRRLAEVFHLVLSEQSLDTLLDRIADTLAELIPYDALHVYEADLARRHLVPVLARSEWQAEIMQDRPAFGQGITGWAALHEQPVLANSAHLDPRVAFVPGTPAEPESLITVPLIARGSLKGALNIYRLGDGASFHDDEFELAKWFGDAAALALDNAQVRARLEHQAQTDSLTGLYNHRHFHERLRAELTRASRVRDSVALLIFDIDDFKRVNDICGHAVGDQILVALSEIACSLVRTSDVVCRIGGEEFAVILPSCDAADGLGLARRLTERLEARPIDAAGEITVSVGVAQGPDHAMNPRELVACAEAAMMTAKARGKNRIVLFNEETSERPGREAGDRDARSIAHLKMLRSLAARLSRLSDVRDIGEAIVDELRMLIDYHNCRVYLVDDGECVPVAARGDMGIPPETPVSSLRLKLGHGVTGHVAATGRALLIPNAVESEHYLPIPGTEPIDESVIAVPLRHDSEILGVVFLSKLGLDQFDENDLRLIEVLAGYASAALENARRYEGLARERDRANELLELSDALSSVESAGEVGAAVVEAAARVLELEHASLWLRDGSAESYRCMAAAGGEDAGLEGRTIRLSAAEQLLGGRTAPFVVSGPDGSAETGDLAPGDALAPLPEDSGLHGWVAARPRAGEELAEDWLLLLGGLAERAAVALRRARR
jgi:diguanylate cyclase (GGDEF)-like protein